MKKVVIAILLVTVLFTLAACSQTETTKAVPRWANNEHYVFNIRLADMSENQITYLDQTYWTEPLASSYDHNPTDLDQLVPLAIGGTFTMDLTLSSGERQCVYKTEQKLYAQYATSTLKEFDLWSSAEFQRLVVSDEDAIAAGMSVEEDVTTLLSVTNSEVVFENNASQSPISSKISVDGFYLGKTYQCVSNYEKQTTYNWQDSKLYVTVNGEEHYVGKYTTGKLIDSNQLLLYVRSLEKTSTKFQDSPTIQLFNSTDLSVSKASLLFTYNCNTVIHNQSTDPTFVKLNAVGVIINSSAALYQLNLPETVNKNNNLDKVSYGDQYLDKFTTVRFRSGFVSYELAEYDSAIVDAISVGASTEE